MVVSREKVFEGLDVKALCSHAVFGGCGHEKRYKWEENA
jgi:hypothetical protein